MKTYTPTPDYYNDYICHFNKNHDPKNGQFTTGPGGPVTKKKSYYDIHPDQKPPRSLKETVKDWINRPKNMSDLAIDIHNSEESKIKDVAESNQDMFNDILSRAILDGDKTAINDFTEEINRIAKENNIDAFKLEGIVNDTYNEYLGSKIQKAKTDFDGDTYTLKDLHEYINSKGDIVSKKDLKTLDKIQRWDDTDRYFENASENVKKQIKEGTMTNDPTYSEFTVGKDNDKISVYGFKDQGVDAKTVKEITAKVLTDKSKIEKLAVEMMKDDEIYERWYKQMPWAGDLSENEFYNKLALKSVFVPNPDYPNQVEVSFYEKDEDNDWNLIGGHSLDIDVSLNDLKHKSKYGVSVNG